MSHDGGPPLAGQVAVVTGASRRIGRATALALAQDGAKVVITAHRAQGEIEAVAADIERAGGQALALLLDVSDEASVAAAFEEIKTKFGRVDILINNAAIRKQSPFLEMPIEDWHAIMRVILDGAFHCCRAALPLMIANGGGTIVNIGGVTAHIGAANRASVSTAKAGLIGLTKALAVEFADRGVTVNCVVPGKIGGERSASAGASPISDSAILLGREGTVEEAAAVIRMMCQPGSRFMTGQTVHVSGGLYLP